MRLKCNVLERRREGEKGREKPGHVMQLEGTAHWQNVERIKKRRRLQTLFLYRLACDLLLFAHLTAGEEHCLYKSVHLKHNKPRGGLTRREKKKGNTIAVL